LIPNISVITEVRGSKVSVGRGLVREKRAEGWVSWVKEGVDS